jgi:hypothetical protein
MHVCKSLKAETLRARHDGVEITGRILGVTGEALGQVQIIVSTYGDCDFDGDVDLADFAWFQNQHCEAWFRWLTTQPEFCAVEYGELPVFYWPAMAKQMGGPR